MSAIASVDYRGPGTVNRFRKRRATLLRAQMAQLCDRLGRSVVVLDVGGRPDYWVNVGLEGIAQVQLLNVRAAELERPLPPDLPPQIFSHIVGDARDLAAFDDQSIDLAHSNSVIEHVGRWGDMRRMATEMRRVGLSGWVQTPAWTFPMEPHFHTPFMHWMAAPLRARMLSLSLRRRFRRMSLESRRLAVESINLLSRREVTTLFPDSELYVERWMLIAKSYTAWWMPGASEPPTFSKQAV